jgi:hypothetical protein
VGLIGSSSAANVTARRNWMRLTQRQLLGIALLAAAIYAVIKVTVCCFVLIFEQRELGIARLSLNPHKTFLIAGVWQHTGAASGGAHRERAADWCLCQTRFFVIE